MLDDGAIVYLNGGEAYRLGLSGNSPLYTDFANRTVGDAALEGPAKPDGLTNLVSGLPGPEQLVESAGDRLREGFNCRSLAPPRRAERLRAGRQG